MYTFLKAQGKETNRCVILHFFKTLQEPDHQFFMSYVARSDNASFPSLYFFLYLQTLEHTLLGWSHGAGINGKCPLYSSMGRGGVFKGEAPLHVWHVSAGPQATGWRKEPACGGLFVCVKLAWPPVPLHLVPISRAESIKQRADSGWEHSSSCLDHGVYYLAVCAVPAGEPAVTRPRLLRINTRRAVCQRADRRRTGKRGTSNGCDS